MSFYFIFYIQVGHLVLCNLISRAEACWWSPRLSLWALDSVNAKHLLWVHVLIIHLYIGRLATWLHFFNQANCICYSCRELCYTTYIPSGVFSGQVFTLEGSTFSATNNNKTIRKYPSNNLSLLLLLIIMIIIYGYSLLLSR